MMEPWPAGEGRSDGDDLEAPDDDEDEIDDPDERQPTHGEGGPTHTV